MALEKSPCPCEVPRGKKKGPRAACGLVAMGVPVGVPVKVLLCRLPKKKSGGALLQPV